MRFSDAFTFSIKVDPQIETEWVHIPPMIVQPYVENAVLHGIAECDQAAGHINVDFQLKDDKLQVSILDNGIGIEAAKQKKAEQNHEALKAKKSDGMTITQKRLELLNQPSYALTIIDRQQIGEGSGTIIRFEAPID